jgi:hypothetical protein
MAETDKLALDGTVDPSRVLPGHPQHQRPDWLRDGRTARLPSRIGPTMGDQLIVPAQRDSR